MAKWQIYLSFGLLVVWTTRHNSLIKKQLTELVPLSCSLHFPPNNIICTLCQSHLLSPLVLHWNLTQLSPCCSPCKHTGDGLHNTAIRSWGKKQQCVQRVKLQITSLRTENNKSDRYVTHSHVVLSTKCWKWEFKFLGDFSRKTNTQNYKNKVSSKR